MNWITHTWQTAVDGARTWGREARAEWRDTVREITGPADADRWAAERARQAAAGPTWLARDGERIVEVDADGHPGREASPDDGRPVAEAESDAGQAYVVGCGEEFAAYWGGEGPAWEAQAEATTAEPAPGAGPYDVPWWDGERMASDRERSPGLVAELEAEPG